MGNLVSTRRFGAALNARRIRRNATLAAVSRQSGGWWAPDELQVIEQGAVAVDDASVIALSRLYGLTGRALPTGEQAEVILDRSIASDLTGVEPVETAGFGRYVVARLRALARLLGVEPTRPSIVEAVAEALTWSPDDALAELASPDRAAEADLLEVLSSRVVVPEIGVLVAETDAGALVFTERRARGLDRPPAHPAYRGAGALRGYVRSTSLAGPPSS